MWDDKEYLYQEIQMQKQILAQLAEMLEAEPGSEILKESQEQNQRRLEKLVDAYYKAE